MLSPSKICTNCAPIIFEYYQKGLATQTELLRMRDELQRLNFTKQLGTLKDLSDAEMSVSPQGKYHSNSRISGKRPFVLNLAQKGSSRLDKQASLATTATIVRSSTPSGKFSTKTVKDCHVHQKKQKDPLTSVNTILQPTLESVSPLERLRDFENQVNKKVDSFKQRLREEVARSAKRPSCKTIPSRPKTSAKALRFLEDDESKINPKVSMFSPDEVKKNIRASPIQFNLTPRYDAKENVDKGSGPSKGEWTVGTNKEYRPTTNTDRGLIHTNAKRELDSSIKKIKMNFKKELDMMTVRDKEASSPGPHDKKLNSPFFSPLRASELMSPNGHHHHFARTEELKTNYSQFIKPNSNPLLDSLMLSPRENEGRLTDRTNRKHSPLWRDKSSGKKRNSQNNYFGEMMTNQSEESPRRDFMKRDKDFFKNSNMKNIQAQDDLQTSHGAPKFVHSQSFNKFGNLLYQK